MSPTAEPLGPPVAVLFDDSRKALEFALNESWVAMPQPYMNKAMAQGKSKPPSKAALKRQKRAQRDAKLSDEPIQLLERENAPKSRKTPWGPRPLGGLDRPHQAGLILALFAKLDKEHQTVLKGRLIRAYVDCSCRSPCCQGWRRDMRWASAVKDTCLLLERVGDITRAPGKRGLSTQPAMRLSIVEQWYTERFLTLEATARLGKVNTVTAKRHLEWISAYLQQTEDEAWLRIDTIFDEAQITGAFT